ncbi:hypothetical protein TWF192_003939 [Orbilia oligospora]|uniref:Uncharacterized protein n=1 Tax=Orbilia oligospora TaxID=2813651 RepID=A0A6G1MMM6_ORBOL|nr:hypothetical protein TWF191_007140 [Orbilia oligospora]KAF3264251.1 hypothetical protein TWF192_003939 [Orbilia oligospora]
MNSFTELDSVRQQLEAFRFPSPTPTIRSHKIWSGQHLEPYLPSPRSMSPNLSLGSYFDSSFVDSAYASPSAEELPLSPTTRKAMTLEDTLSELESIVRKYEVDEQMSMDSEEPKSFWEEDSDDDDEDYDFVDEAYDSGCFTEDDESFETRLASLQPPTKRPRLSEPEPPRDTSCSGTGVTGTSGVTILKPSASLRLSKRMRMKRRQLSIPRSMPTGTKTVPAQGGWWSPKKPSPAFIDIFQF